MNAPRNRARYSSEALRQGRAGVGPSKNIAGKLIAVGSVIIAVAAIVIIGRYFYQANKINASPTVSSFERIDDSTMRAGVDVARKRPNEPVYCVVTALAYDKDEVGRREFLIAPSEEKLLRFDITIPTRSTAVAAKVYGCSSTIPSYLTEATPGQAPK